MDAGACRVTSGEAGGLPQGDQLVLGVAWSAGRPSLDLTSVRTGSRHRVPLLHRRLGLRVTTPGHFCTGWYGFVDGDGRLHPCPDRALATTSSQCESCALRDQFRFAHQGHVGGYVPAALEPYLASPHWLYIATFADGISKVGTASEHRKRDRLDEQGPALASYVAHAANGRLVREAEDAVSRELQVPQHRRRAAKVAALAAPAAGHVVAERHRETAAQAARLIADTVRGPALCSLVEPWLPPAAMGALREPPPHGSWVPYPHPLTAGEHGWEIEACAGSSALGRTEPGEDAVRFLVDLGQLKGRRIVLGAFSSRPAEVQEAMF
jgi:hypothetical protein